MTYEVARNFIVNPNNDKILRLHVTYVINRTSESEFGDSFFTVVVPEGVNKDFFIERALTHYLSRNKNVLSFEKHREEYRWV